MCDRVFREREREEKKKKKKKKMVMMMMMTMMQHKIDRCRTERCRNHMKSQLDMSNFAGSSTVSSPYVHSSPKNVSDMEKSTGSF